MSHMQDSLSVRHNARRINAGKHTSSRSRENTKQEGVECVPMRSRKAQRRHVKMLISTRDWDLVDDMSEVYA